MKKWLCMLLCMAMTTSASPVWAAGNTEEDKATEAAAGDETAFSPGRNGLFSNPYPAGDGDIGKGR